MTGDDLTWGRFDLGRFCLGSTWPATLGLTTVRFVNCRPILVFISNKLISFYMKNIKMWNEVLPSNIRFPTNSYFFNIHVRSGSLRKHFIDSNDRRLHFFSNGTLSQMIFCLLEICKVLISFSHIYMWLRIEEILFPTKIYMLEITFIMVSFHIIFWVNSIF